MAMTLTTPFVPSLKASTNTKTNRKLESFQVGRWECRKKDGMHPDFYNDAKVHPFYLGSRSSLLIDADQVEKFRKKYGQLTSIMEIPVLRGEIILPPKKKASSKGKGKK